MRPIALALLGLFAVVAVSAQEDEDVSGRARELWMRHAYPSMSVDPSVRLRGWHDWVAMPTALGTGLSAQDASTWTSIGPQSLVNGSSKYNGRVTAIAVHPTNASVLYIGTNEGGIWKSTDAGTTWFPLTDGQPCLQCDAVAIDPVNTNTIYAGTGSILPYLTHAGALHSYVAMGLLKTTDGGATWQLLGSDVFLGAAIHHICIDPANTSRLYIAATNGVWLSEDSGLTFRQLLSGFATGLAVLSGSPNTLYAGIGDIYGAADNGLYISRDDGQTWSLMTNLPLGSSIGRIEIGLSASNNAIAYVCFVGTANNSYITAFYKTTDRGNTWTSIGYPNDGVSYHWFVELLSVHPTNPNVVYFGSIPLYRTTNGGTSWSQVGSNVHVDQHAMCFAPSNPSVVYLGNDGGIYRGSNSDGSVSFTDVNSSLVTALFYSVATHPTNTSIALGGLQDNGVGVYGGSGAWVNRSMGDGVYAGIDRATPTRMYCTSQYGPVNRSTDGGNNWGNVFSNSDSALFLHAFLVSPVTPTTLFNGTYRVWRSATSGATWAAISGDLTRGGDPEVAGVSAIGQAPSNANRLYAGTGDGKLWTTPDGGSHWTDLSSLIPNRWVTWVTVHPTNPLVAYVGLGGHGSGHVFRTTDGGATFQDVTRNLPDLIVAAVRFDPLNPSMVYVGNELGIVVGDGNSDWQKLGTGLPAAAVLGIEPNSTTNILRVATFGRGMWDTPLTRTLSATVSLETWLGGDLPVTFDLVPAAGGASVKTWNITPVNGVVTLTAVPNGDWALRAKASHWLSQLLPLGARAGNVSDLAFSLLNGDATGDNAVNLLDLSSILAAFGTSGYPPEDLNGDGNVNLLELSIVLMNFGQTGQ